MLTLEQVRQLMQDRNIKAVASATGLNPHTIYRLVHDKTDPSFSTVKALSDYLEGQMIHG